jgi:hypothetical protein
MVVGEIVTGTDVVGSGIPEPEPSVGETPEVSTSSAGSVLVPSTVASPSTEGTEAATGSPIPVAATFPALSAPAASTAINETHEVPLATAANARLRAAGCRRVRRERGMEGWAGERTVVHRRTGAGNLNMATPLRSCASRSRSNPLR